MYCDCIKMDVPYPFRGCEKCPFTDKSRPYLVRTLADLLLANSQNFSHSEMSNKSQTRNFNMSPLFYYAVGASGMVRQLSLFHRDIQEQGLLRSTIQ